MEYDGGTRTTNLRRDLLESLLVEVIRGSLRPLSEADLVSEAEMYLGSMWTDVSKDELLSTARSIEDERVEVDGRGRFYGIPMPQSIDDALPHRTRAMRCASNLEDTEGSGADEPRRALMKNFFAAPLLTPEQERDLAWERDRGSVAARNTLVLSNTRLAHHMGRAWLRRLTVGMDEDDLLQEACVGLLRAAEKFDADLGYKFSTYATWWIRQSVSRAWMDQSRTIRVPVHVGDRITKVDRAKRQLEARGESASIGRLADMTKLYPAVVASTLRASEVSTVPLSDLSQSDEYGAAMREMPLLEDELIEHESTGSASEAFLSLPLRERQVLELRLGLDGHDRRTLDEVGSIFGVTRERIRQIETDALKQLRSQVTQ